MLFIFEKVVSRPVLTSGPVDGNAVRGEAMGSAGAVRRDVGACAPVPTGSSRYPESVNSLATIIGDQWVLAQGNAHAFA